MIDVIIVNYEGGAMVLNAIRASLAAHERDDMRFIVVDNGSRGAAHAALFENRPLAALLGGVRETSAEGIVVHVPFECIHESSARIPVIRPGLDVRTVRITQRWSSRRGDLFIKLDRNHGFETGVNVATAVSRDGGFAGAPDCANWQRLSKERRRDVYRSYCAWLKRADGHPRNDVVLLGSDVRPSPGCFSELAKTARLHPSIGLVGAKLVQQQTGGLFVVGGGYTEDPDPLHHTGWDATPGPWHTFQNCPWLTFSCVYIKRTCLGSVGTMDMQLFPYGGDVDYSRRARRNGFANVFCPTACALHQHESRTVVRVMRAMPPADWIVRTAASQRYFFFKWVRRRVPQVKLPAGVFAPMQNGSARSARSAKDAGRKRKSQLDVGSTSSLNAGAARVKVRRRFSPCR